MMAKASYSIDTSALLDGLKRYYPQTNFRRLWEEIDGLILDGRVFISEEVWEEVKVQDDEVSGWLSERRQAVLVPTNAQITSEVTQILLGNERLVMNMKGRNRADPFVIAVARLNDATVVTGEGSDGTPTRPKIPYVCQQLGIPTMRLLDVIQAEGWIF